ncbi:MAG: DUF2141 domain-containing protein [Pseudomonadota bacterium]
MIRRAVLLAGLLAVSASPAAELTVTVSGVRDAAGQVKLMLFDRAEGFRKEDQARAVLVRPAAPGQVEARFGDLPPGKYAVIAYHDENGDGQLNLRFGMFPKEGYGLSNNPKLSGPPRFANAAFELGQTPHSLDISLKY